MQLNRLSGLSVIFCLALFFLSQASKAELSANDSRALLDLKQACSNHGHQIDALLAKPGAAAQTLTLLQSPTGLNSTYWTIRDRSLKLPIRDAFTARDFSAIDGKLGMVELACAGYQDTQAWKALSSLAIRGGKIDTKTRDRLVSAWKASVRKRLAGNLTYTDYTKIMDTAYYLAQRRLLGLPQASINTRRAIDDQMREPSNKASLVPAIGNPSDPKWVGWGKYTQSRGIKERNLMPAMKQSLASLVK